MFLLLGCTTPDFRTFSDPVMSTEAMQVELELLHEINLTVKNGDFDHSAYPMSVGVDPRNGKMLVEKFICWDAARMWAWSSCCTGAWRRRRPARLRWWVLR